ncbi:hypothetical protein D3C86_1115890 [compost metagenome]
MKGMSVPHDFLAAIRAICLALPEAEEYLMHDHPAFRVSKKPFVIMGEADFSLKVPILDQPLYLEDPRFTLTHYIGRYGWVTMKPARQEDWGEIPRLIGISYRQAAPKRLLKTLEA